MARRFDEMGFNDFDRSGFNFGGSPPSPPDENMPISPWPGVPVGNPPTPNPVLIPPFGPGDGDVSGGGGGGYNPDPTGGGDVRGPKPFNPGGPPSIGGPITLPHNPGFEPPEDVPSEPTGPPPTSFNPPSSAPRFNSGGAYAGPANNTVVSPPPTGPFNQPPSGRPNVGSYRAYRPNLKTRNDAFLRGNRVGGMVPDPAFMNPTDTGYGGLRVGGYNDPSNPLLDENQRRRRQNDPNAGAFGLGLGG